MTSDGKFTLTTTPILPAKCASCFREANGKIEFVDFGFSLDYYGAVHFCRLCAEELATVLGFTSELKVEIEKAKLQSVLLDCENLVAKVEALERVIDLYGFGHSDGSTDSESGYSEFAFENERNSEDASGSSEDSGTNASRGKKKDN